MATSLTSAFSPETLRQHGLAPEEYEKIKQLLGGREPTITELGIFSVMWSEHCSYKSSRVHLKRLPTRSKRVLQGPGENAGIIDIGDGWACAFKIESHNHPSFIEPFQGATTGVGGILRDIFTMGARPVAVMDSLRFGPIRLEHDAKVRTAGQPRATVPTQAEIHRNHSILEGVVSGVASYGNCFGVPNLGGETKFEPCYSGNPLVNAFALGLVRKNEIFYARAAGEGNPVIYVGAKTGRDGIHGATMASEEFKEGSEQKRPNVQVGDPFMEKLLLEACLEAMQTGAVVGIQDMGAAGLTCSTCEMGARGGVGLEVELDHVPQRETGMSAYEIMLSESQERMLLVAEKGREQEILRVFDKWGLEGVIVGTVIPEPRLRIFQHDELVADIPNQSLTDDAPLYHRPVGTWARPEQIKVPLDPPPHILEELKKPRDYTADLKKLLASPNICSKRWVYEQYDSMVQTNTVQGPGGEAGVMRIKGTQRGLAMALAGNSRWCYLDPKLGAMHAVAEAARKVACSGATPVAATNCLNFGNPEKPEIMAQLSAAIDGIAEACTALGTPITGGNVSLYNETKGEGIYPTPVVGVVGIIDDVTKAVPASFQDEREIIAVLQPVEPSPYGDEDAAQNFHRWSEDSARRIGSSEFVRSSFAVFWGTPPPLSLEGEARLQQGLVTLARERVIAAAKDICDGGMAVALAQMCFPRGIGATVGYNGVTAANALFEEHPSEVIITYREADQAKVKSIAEFLNLRVNKIGETEGNHLIIANSDGALIESAIGDLRAAFEDSLESQLAAEVTA